MNRLKTLFVLDKTDVDKILLWGVQVETGENLQYIAVHNIAILYVSQCRNIVSWFIIVIQVSW